MGKKKEKIILPPELPPDIAEDEIEVSDEDMQFVHENREFAGFVSSMDTQSINKHVNRVANAKGDSLEALYELRSKRKSQEKESDERGLQVDRVDALPVKTLDGEVYYRKVPEKVKEYPNALNDGEIDDDDEDGLDKGTVRLTKAEKRARTKKIRKEAKKKEKELVKTEEVQQTPQAEVLAEVKKDISAEGVFEDKKLRLAELGMALLEDPESNIKSLKEMLQITNDDDHAIVKLGLLSLLAVFKDIIPGYRIRLPTEKELEMTVSKVVKKTRYYESTLLSSYKAYLQKLIILEQQPLFQRVAVRCFCTLLDGVPHFNFRNNLLAVVVRNIGSPDDVIRKLCCTTVKSLFTNEGKHGGEATVEAVRLIANHVKDSDCQLHPDSIEVFMSLSFDDDLGKSEASDLHNKFKGNKNKRKKNLEEPSQLKGKDRKKNRKDLMTKMREEVNAEFKAASFTPDVMERRRMQTETLSAVFQTYFRILKHTMQPATLRSEVSDNSLTGASSSHPLLASCLNGLGKFSHLIDLDFMRDLMNYLKKLARGGSDSSDGSSENSLKSLTVSERLQCCIVAFKVMRSNLDALNVDLQDFFVQLYNLVLEYRPGRDKGEVLAEALKTMLCEDRHHDMQKAAAFIKRLATFALCFGSAEAMAALVTLKHLLVKNAKCRNLLENDSGGGSVSGSIAANYQPYATDPNLSGALASVLWELTLLSKHYHPSVSTMASSIATMTTAQNQVYLSNTSPIQAFADLSVERDSFNPKIETKKLNVKRKRGNVGSTPSSFGLDLEAMSEGNEEKMREKLSEHFVVLRDIKENARLRSELDRTNLGLQLYEEYKKGKKGKDGGPKPRKKVKAF